MAYARPGADQFVRNLHLLLSPGRKDKIEIPIIKTIASQKAGIDLVVKSIGDLQSRQPGNERKSLLLAEQAFHLIQNRKMKKINKIELREEIEKATRDGNFNLYHFVEKYS